MSLRGARAMIYLNHAASSFPKPEPVISAVEAALRSPPEGEGRGGELASASSRCRAALAALFAVRDPGHVILTASATHALNLAIHGVLAGRPGGHAVTSLLEHNSLLRPLAHAARDRGLCTTWLEPDPEGRISPEAVASALRRETRIVALAHVSNVTGSVQPIEEIAAVAADAGVPLVVDAAQSAGAVELAHGALPGRGFVALAGHKGLLGPTGTGALIVPDASLPPLLTGGTGVRSESELQPEELPLRLEAGTANGPGLAGLAAALELVLARGVATLGARRAELLGELRRELAAVEGVELVAPLPHDRRGGLVCLRHARHAPEELAYLLRASFEIVTRAGLHCAPRAHAWLGSAPRGSVRVSVGASTTEAEVSALCAALRRLA